MSKEYAAEESVLKEAESRALQSRQAAPGLLLIGFGVVLLLANLFRVDLITFLWPGFVIVPGLLLMWPAYSMTAERPSRLAFLAVPGAMVTAVGLLLLAMNSTGHFEAWAYSWTLVIAAVPAALMYIRRFEPQHSVHQNGRQFMRVMIILFMSLAAFFEIIVFQNFNPLLPLALIAFGVYLLVQQRRSA